MARRRDARPWAEQDAEAKAKRARVEQVADWLAAEEGFFEDLIEFFEDRSQTKADRVARRDWPLFGNASDQPLEMIRDVAEARGYGQAINDLRWLVWLSEKLRRER